MLFDMKCPSCGATMQFDDSKESMFCPYCGGRVTNMAEQVNVNQNINVSGTVVHVQDRSNEPNLYITYNTNNPAVGMVTRIVTTGVKSTYVNGQTLTYHLNQGPHTVVLKIGKKNYNRNIVIPPDNSPVRIYASFNGRAQISIDQPNIPTMPASTPIGSQSMSSQAPVQQVQMPQTVPGKPKAPLSIVAFVLSLTMYFSWAGAALGTVETFVLDKNKEKNHLFSYLAMGIGTFFTLFILVGLLGSGSKKTDATAPSAIESVSEITTEVVSETTVETAVETTTVETTEQTTLETTEATATVTPVPTNTPTPTTVSDSVTNGLDYTTNSKDDYKDGDHGVYSYVRSAGSYDIYIIIDFDEGYIYYFCHGNGDEICDRLEIDSGDLNSLCYFSYYYGEDDVDLYAVNWAWKRSPNHLLLQDSYGNSWDYYPTDLDEALALRDSKEIVDYIE